MWTPTQLLNEQTLQTLREAGFGELKLEFLGWLSYNASALNNSRNPVKAAHTILAGEKAVAMFKIYENKKKESVRPKERREHEAIDEEFNKLEKWIQGVEADAEPNQEPPWDS